MPCNCLWVPQEKDVSESLIENSKNAKNEQWIMSVPSPPAPASPWLRIGEAPLGGL